MSLTDMIPVQYRILAAMIALGVALAAAALAGATIEGWRLDGSHQREIATEKASYGLLLGQYNDLRVKTTEQNGAVSVLAEKTKSADERREVAEKYAAGLVQTTERRITEIKASKATTCDGVLRDAWGKR